MEFKIFLYNGERSEYKIFKTKLNVYSHKEREDAYIDFDSLYNFEKAMKIESPF